MLESGFKNSLSKKPHMMEYIQYVYNPSVHNPYVHNPRVHNQCVLNQIVYNPCVLNLCVHNQIVYNPCLCELTFCSTRTVVTLSPCMELSAFYKETTSAFSSFFLLP